MAVIQLLLDYEYLRTETDPNDDRISDNYFVVHEWEFDTGTKQTRQLPDRYENENAYGPTPNGRPYSRPTDEEFLQRLRLHHLPGLLPQRCRRVHYSIRSQQLGLWLYLAGFGRYRAALRVPGPGPLPHRG